MTPLSHMCYADLRTKWSIGKKCCEIALETTEEAIFELRVPF